MISTHLVVRTVVGMAALSTLLSGTVQAGDRYRLHHQLPGPVLNARAGWSVEKLADIDGDGLNEILVGCPDATGNGLTGAGCIEVYSGFNGQLIMSLPGRYLDGRLGGAVADAGDVDGDGVNDIVGGATFATIDGRRNCGSVHVFSGRDGSEIWSVAGSRALDAAGTAVCGIGDVNRDGYDDVAIGIPGLDSIGNDVGAIDIISGRTGQAIRRISGLSEGDKFGNSIAAIGDIDGDGFTEIAGGAVLGNGLISGELAGNVLIVSSRNGSRLRRIDGPESGDQIGRSVGDAGDVDNDGIPDVVVGTPNTSPGGQVFAGSAFVFSGRTGRVIHRWDGEQTNVSFGNGVDGLGDLNGDGHSEVIVGAPHTIHTTEPNGTIYVYSGADGSLMFTADGFHDAYAYACCGLGDIDGDGLPDFAVGSPDWNSDEAAHTLEGRVTVFTSAAIALRKLADPVMLGGTMQLELRGSADLAGRRFAILVGLDPTETPLVYPVGPGTASTLDIVPLLSATQTLGLLGALDGSAFAAISASIPTGDSFDGRRLYLQPVLAQPGSRRPAVTQIGNPISITLMR